MPLEDPPVKDVVVLVSADAEWRAIRAIHPAADVRRAPLGEWFTAAGRNRDSELIFFHGGWGKIAAAASTQYVIHHCRPRLVVNLGTCGGLEGEVRRGTVILVERTTVYDIHEQMGDPKEHLAHYTTELDLNWLSGGQSGNVVRGPMLSADRDLRPEDIPWLKREFGAIAVDWESASIAWVARRHGVRTLILRGVSDLVGSSGGEAYDGNLHVFHENTHSIMQRLVAELPDWLARAWD